jgi:hypothetical protein
LDGFISHSSADRSVAVRLEKALEAEGLSVWLDDSEIRYGVLLGEQLRDSIRDAKAMILLWSSNAAASRWVNSEWLTAFHVRRFIVPCSLDDTPLPQCLGTSLRLPIKRVSRGVVEDLLRAVRDAPKGPNELAPLISGQSPELAAAIDSIGREQFAILDTLGSSVAEAQVQQARLDPVVERALATWPLDSTIVNLAGYHLKNAYMLNNWAAVQAGRSPKDPLLDQAEQRFFETLALDPTDPEALNGLGTILTFIRDLEAAEFFIVAAIAEAKRRGISYPAAEHDLALVRRYQRP